tara:strand:- start:1927 stop:2151 length:225 start_codon:yes stop_codon:yes gene_type:complete
MTLELTYLDRDFDVDIEITEAQPQTLEQIGILFSLDIISVTFHHHGEQLIDLMSDANIEALEALALETLVDDTF